MPSPNSPSSLEYEVFLQYLQNTRVAAHLSQSEMAERLGETLAHIQNCESGAHAMNVVEVRDWCRACGVGLADFTRLMDEAIEEAIKAAARPAEPTDISSHD